MKIVNSTPPNYEKLKNKFDIGDKTVFTYGDTIYNPGAWPIEEHLVAHEQTHFNQQTSFGSVEGWWDKYLEDEDFRLSQEIAAYKQQWSTIIKNKMITKKNLYLIYMASDLASGMYGNLMSFDKAIKLIRK